LVGAFELLAPGGNLQSIGWASGEPAVFPPYSTVGPAKSLTSFMMGPAIGPELATLLELIADGRLRVDIGWRGPWDRIDEAVDALLGRRVDGKAVLDVTG
jgi:NADPH:quinone reductase-like Zn-dependent oxidoreductase